MSTCTCIMVDTLTVSCSILNSKHLRHRCSGESKSVTLLPKKRISSICGHCPPPRTNPFCHTFRTIIRFLKAVPCLMELQTTCILPWPPPTYKQSCPMPNSWWCYGCVFLVFENFPHNKRRTIAGSTSPKKSKIVPLRMTMGVQHDLQTFKRFPIF